MEKEYVLTGVHAADQAAIRETIRSITKSPVVKFERLNNMSRDECAVSTADGKTYHASKVRGKWQFEEMLILARVHTYDLTRRCS